MRAPSVLSLNMILSSHIETDLFGRAIGGILKGGEVLALIGNLGAGKTALVRGIAAGLGVPSHSVSSPTFVLAHEYRGRLPMIHIDLYRIKDNLEADASGLSDCFSDRMVVAIEWADRLPTWLPMDRLEVRLTHRKQFGRDLTMSAFGPVSSLLLRDIARAWRTRSANLPRKKIVSLRKASTR